MSNCLDFYILKEKDAGFSEENLTLLMYFNESADIYYRFRDAGIGCKYCGGPAKENKVEVTERDLNKVIEKTQEVISDYEVKIKNAKEAKELTSKGVTDYDAYMSFISQLNDDIECWVEYIKDLNSSLEIMRTLLHIIWSGQTLALKYF